MENTTKKQLRITTIPMINYQEQTGETGIYEVCFSGIDTNEFESNFDGVTEESHDAAEEKAERLVVFYFDAEEYKTLTENTEDLKELCRKRKDYQVMKYIWTPADVTINKEVTVPSKDIVDLCDQQGRLLIGNCTNYQIIWD